MPINVCMGFEPDVVEQGKKTFDGTSQTLNTSFFSAAIQSKSWSEEWCLYVSNENFSGISTREKTFLIQGTLALSHSRKSRESSKIRFILVFQKIPKASFSKPRAQCCSNNPVSCQLHKIRITVALSQKKNIFSTPKNRSRKNSKASHVKVCFMRWQRLVSDPD